MGGRRKAVELPEDIRGTLARNLERLMKSRFDLSSQPKVARKSGVGQSTVGRILRAEVRAELDQIESLSKAFGLRPWQLLFDELDPEAPPTATPSRQALTPSQRAQVEQAKEALLGLSKEQRAALGQDSAVADLLRMEPVADERVEQTLQSSRHGFPPGKLIGKTSARGGEQTHQTPAGRARRLTKG